MSLTASAPKLYRNARLATMRPERAGLGVVEKGAIACRDGRIVFAGAEADMPADAERRAEIIDCGGRWVTPGLVDCHTHLVYAGNRAHEFELRLAGASYEEIARAGGGIVSTVAATRAASRDELVQQSLPRLDALLAEGVTTVEIKSGYGLNADTETKMLEAARELGKQRAVAVELTHLGAHAMPAGTADKDAYIADVVNNQLPHAKAQDLMHAVDGFCEGIAFSVAQIRRVFEWARANNVPVKLHAEQLSNLGGSKLAAEFGAISVDHVEYLDAEGVAAIAKSGTVAVLLPGAFYFIREKQVPPVSELRAKGVPIAIATDCNPGSSPLTSPLLTMNMAATLFRLTVDECLLGMTRHAARALGRLHDIGTLETGKWCDLAIWDIERPAELVYRIGFNPLHQRVWRGQ